MLLESILLAKLSNIVYYFSYRKDEVFGYEKEKMIEKVRS